MPSFHQRTLVRPWLNAHSTGMIPSSITLFPEMHAIASAWKGIHTNKFM